MNIAVIFYILCLDCNSCRNMCIIRMDLQKIAESKGLPSSYMWFGLLGVIGIIIVAVMGPSYPQYPQYPPQNGQNPYQQNTYFGNNPYQQPQQQSCCPHCGAPIDNYSITCSHCGQMLR